MKGISSSRLILLTAVFFMLFGNRAFFANVTEIYPVNFSNLPFLISLAALFGCSIVVLLSIVCTRHTIKPVLIAILLLSSLSAYFMDTYNVVIDDTMIDNIFKTDTAEAMDLVGTRLGLYFLFLGVLPSILVYRANIDFAKRRREAASRVKLLLLSLVIAVSSVLLFSKHYAPFFREHKLLRYYVNPSFYIYSIGKYTASFFKSGPVATEQLGMDARTPMADTHRELVVLVVGETARADRFSLNGYSRETNPLLQKEDLISFTNFWSCGTTTAVSVPCMFSIYTQNDYSKSKAQSSENLLDVLQHAGANVIWLDNNSDSKGVAVRVPYQDYKTDGLNQVCDSECRDEGMLVNLQTYIDSHPHGDIFIVLHQMGNHGPAYFKRYPDAFEKFKPACKSIEFDTCSNEEIDNAYDNAILYTDYFLSKVIALLEGNKDVFEAVMVYISDHGESLGESGVYLHGLPNLFAPDEQRHVPMLMWFSDSFDNRQEHDYEGLKKKSGNRYSHDNLFHTVIRLLEVETAVYDESLDLIGHPE